MTDHPQILDLSLSSLVLDGHHPSLYRDRIGPPEERDPNYDNRYDFHTLIYDCYFDPAAQEVILICPSLLNFRQLIENSKFQIDGVPVRVKKIGRLSRGDFISFAVPGSDPASLTISHDLFGGELKINRLHTDVFADKNVVYAISKDNRLEWVSDWANYYVQEHGANGFVIYDNHSTDYSMEDLKDTFRSIDGVEAFALVRAWFPFGPGGAGNTNFNSKFLHMTMVELGRRRLLAEARAVLNVDIDELVYSKSHRTIFDATVESEQGYVRIDGRWVFADKPEKGAVVRHSDHGLIRKDGKPKVNRKYCVAPNGPLRGKPWLTHRIISRRDPTSPEFGFWHFRKISNNWDYNREDLDHDLLVLDPRLADTMSRVFGVGDPVDRSASVQVSESPLVAKSTGRAEKALVITSMKNEGPYILEWIAYHRAIGFDHFLVYTNDCSDGTDLILDRLAELGLVTHERNKVLKRGPQKSALKYAYDHPVVSRADWILVSDVDEFLNIKLGQGRLNDLLGALPGADVIPVVWRLFSNDSKIAFSENLVLEDYTDAELPISKGGQGRRFAKSLFRNRPEFERFGTHGPVHPDEFLDRIRWVLPDGGGVTPETRTRPEGSFGYEAAQINHYATRSVDSYLVKKDRGRVNHYRQDMGLDYWVKMNRGGEVDTSIARWIEPTRKEMQRISQDKVLAKLIANSVTWHRNRINELRKLPEYQDLRNQILSSTAVAEAN